MKRAHEWGGWVGDEDDWRTTCELCGLCICFVCGDVDHDGVDAAPPHGPDGTLDVARERFAASLGVCEDGATPRVWMTKRFVAWRAARCEEDARDGEPSSCERCGFIECVVGYTDRCTGYVVEVEA